MTDYTEDNDEGMIEPDPGHIAFLDQQSAEFQGEREEFKQTYGFDHECTCGLDYAANRVGMVTECFLRLCADALDQCAKANALNGVLNEALNESLTISNGLAKLMQDLGHEKELDEYIKSQMELEGESSVDLDKDLQALSESLEELFNEQNNGEESES